MLESFQKRDAAGSDAAGVAEPSQIIELEISQQNFRRTENETSWTRED